jgi:C-terminal processing protease CtpA/Prc
MNVALGNRNGQRWPLLLFAVFLLSWSSDAFAQDEKLTNFERERARQMLQVIRGDIKKNYYSATFNGLDLDLRFKQAEDKINSAKTMNFALADIAGAVGALNDSHTFFMPPPRPYVHDYGLRIQAIGDSDCFVTAVRPGSDAEKKGIRAGDQVLAVNGYTALRDDMWKIRYVFNILRPQPALRLVLRSPEGTTQNIETMAFLRNTKRLESFSDFGGLEREAEAEEDLHRPRHVEYGKDAIIWKLPDFRYLTDAADEMLDDIRSHNALVLDLRGNPGGSVDFLSHFLGGMFDHELKIADRIGRKPLKPQMTRSRGGKTFSGKLIVLVDSDSGSASELFARVVQLEKRGIVVGDRSSGSVMESRIFPERSGMDIVTFYGISITEADLVMTDGKTLEHSGVIPDERLLPTPVDLAANRDPVLAHAAELAGIKMTPEDAGKLFPVLWRPH